MKKQIQAAFNKSVNSYDDNCKLQENVGLSLLNKLKKYNVKYNNIIDLGCGTGKITKYFSSYLIYNNFEAIDLADLLLSKAKHELKDYKVQCYIADFDNKFINKFDLIYSTMALQWSLNLNKTIKNIYQSLNKNGIFAFAIPLKGTFNEIDKESRNQFMSYEEILHILKKNKFLLLETNIENFNEIGIKSLKTVKNTGANLILKGKTQNILTLSKIRNLMLNYKIGYFICKKI